MKSQIADLTYAKIFLSTITFKTWQKFCDGRSHFKISSQTNIKIKSRPPTQKDLKKYIIPAKTFQTWLKTYKLRTKISNFLTGKLKTILIRYVPKSTRLQLKKSLNILTCFSDSGVSTMIALEWQTWMQRRQNGSLDIIIFGITSFDYRFQRPQQLAYALANLGHRIFYIESEFNFVGNQSRSGVQIRKEAKNIFVVKLSALENYFIYKDFPTVQGRAILFKSLKKLFKLARIINPVAKIDHPFWGSIAQSLKMPLIYDAMDLHSGFPETGKSIEKYERELTSVSDLILTSSDYIQKEFLKFKQKSLMVRNAGDFYHFSKAKNKMVKPIDLMEFSGKIIGYYGAISDWMDDKIIKQLAINCPDVEIVIIGRVQNQKLVELAQVYLNIHLLGEKPYQELPNYLSYFDVCLIPFKITNLIKATNPVKIYEYFASGKPVVTTEIPELLPYSDQVYFGKTPKEFVNQVKKALSEDSPEKQIARQIIAKKNTWEMRAKSIETKIKSLVFPKVSIVILIYNQPRLSKIAIESVLNRSKYPNFELILVDNKSNFETLKMLKTYQTQPNVKLILNSENLGFAKGNNLGMKTATGEYIVLLNNDVRVTPGWIERLVYHVRGSKAGLVGPVTNSIGNESKIEINYESSNLTQMEEAAADYTYAHWGETLELRNIAAFAWIVTKKIYQKLGGFDERFGKGLFEDDDYCFRVKKAGLSIFCAEDVFIHHYGGASTNWGSPEFQALFNKNKAEFEKKWQTKWIPHQYRKK